MIYFLLFAISPFLAVGLYRLLFVGNTPDRVMRKHADKKTATLTKKYPEADMQQMTGVFWKTGLALSLGFVLYAFTYADQPEVVADLDGTVVLDEIEQLPPQSIQKPPPPPPPPPPPVLEVVEDEEIIEEEPEIIDVEADEDTEIEIPEELPEIEDEGLEDIFEEPEIEEEIIEEPPIFTIVEDMPEFQGGQKKLFKWLSKQVKYPPMARENGVEGTVYVGFVVMEDGSIQNVHVKRGLPGGGAGCDAEAIRVAQDMPKWKPGKQRGKNVRVAYTLPFKFKLD
ncbi:MAG: energy transducer TonB [Chitinophagales bacterium]